MNSKGRYADAVSITHGISVGFAAAGVALASGALLINPDVVYSAVVYILFAVVFQLASLGFRTLGVRATRRPRPPRPLPGDPVWLHRPYRSREECWGCGLDPELQEDEIITPGTFPLCPWCDELRKVLEGCAS